MREGSLMKWFPIRNPMYNFLGFENSHPLFLQNEGASVSFYTRTRTNYIGSQRGQYRQPFSEGDARSFATSRDLLIQSWGMSLGSVCVFIPKAILCCTSWWSLGEGDLREGVSDDIHHERGCFRLFVTYRIRFKFSLVSHFTICYVQCCTSKSCFRHGIFIQLAPVPHFL